MRNLYQCDICGKVLEGTNPNSMPKGFMKVDSYDMCINCIKEYRKRYFKFIDNFAKDMGNKLYGAKK